jgi:DNA-binding NtrC family response regulator
MELADGGTLFLDEVEAMSPRLQVMLLRALEYGELQKVGQDRSAQRVDVRIVAASNQDLRELVAQGTFREDLYYRFDVVGIRVPALRERSEDISLLATYFLGRFRDENGGGPHSIADDTMDMLRRHRWPGNVRELRNAIRRAAVLCDGDQIRVHDLPPGLVRRANAMPPSAPRPTAELDLAAAGLDGVIAGHIQRVLAAVDGNKSKAAQALGIPRTSLYHKLRKYRISGSYD